MKNKDFKYGPMRNPNTGWNDFFFSSDLFDEGEFRRETGSYDYLMAYSGIHNLFTANTPQPNPFSNRAMYIINTLSNMGVKFSIDIFEFDGANAHWDNSHKLVNIIAEPNPQVEGPATVFCAHHDVANIHSQNCQDNGASVCNLLKLTSLIHKAPTESKRTLILFSDCEEYGARGAKRFATNTNPKKSGNIINHRSHGEIESVINLELTGKGNVVWSDCSNIKRENDLHQSLESVLGKTIPKLNTPPSDAMMFRKYDYPVLCIGTLPENDLKDRQTWRLCHSLRDTIDGCNRKDMEDFTNFLFNLTKTKPALNEDTNGDAKT